MRKFTRWDEKAPTSYTNDRLRGLALRILQEAKPGGAVEVLRDMFNRRDYASVVNYEFDYDQLAGTVDLLDVVYMRQAVALFSKRADLDIGIDKRETAVEKFLEADALCAETNVIFRKWSLGHFQFAPDVESVLHGAMRKISKCLGDVPALCDLKVRFGPGATTKVKKEDSSWRNKLSSGFQCSEEFLPMLCDALMELPAWVASVEEQRDSVFVWEDEFGVPLQSKISFSDEASLTGHGACLTQTQVAEVPVEVVTGVLSFVPKNAKTFRTVKPEPVLNQMFQLGIGGYMAERLSALGVDISDQTRNQRLALEGSLTGALATLDLSSASDTISEGLVCHLLPLEWYCLLSNMRSRWVQHPRDPDQLLETSMFSLMGNGFTFPLETLIFWSLASASAELVDSKGEIAVYGDDIIVGVDVVPLLTRVLHAVGFKVNLTKSYWTGSFRESCGKDYLSGIDVRPCYLKDCLTCENVFTLHNFFWRSGERGIAEYILEWLDESVRLYGPDGFGDCVLLHDNPILTPHNRDRGWGGFTFDAWTWCSRKSFAVRTGDQVLPGYSVYVNPPSPYQDLKRVFEGCIDLPGRPLTDWLGQEGTFSILSHSYCDEAGGWCLYEPAAGPNLLRKVKIRGRDVFKTGSVLPGTAGFKRISIYTLRPA